MKAVLLACALYAGAIGAAYAQQENLFPDQKRDIEAIAMKYFEAINAGEAEKAAPYLRQTACSPVLPCA